MTCPDCGGTIIGDGYSTVLHCENVDIEICRDFEPDTDPVYCGEVYPKDKIPVILEKGVTYMSKEQIEKYGTKFMDAINSGEVKVSHE